VNRLLRRFLLAFACLFTFTVALPAQTTTSRKTKNVIFVMTDGLRWQEVFNGAQQDLIDKKNGVPDVPALKKLYWRATPEERRLALMPFLWSVIAKQGQIFGNRQLASDAFVTNGFFFSYPGYNEALCGFADPRINSNDKVPNPNVTVLEWLKREPSFQGELAAFGAWDVIAAVFNPDRSGLVANAGWDPFNAITTPQLDLLNHLKAETPRVWEDEPFDTLPFYTALEYLKSRKPRVLYLSLGETDDWAHARRYGLYLEAAHRVDDYLRVLWQTFQSIPEYRDSTTLIFSTDHGRGSGKKNWTSHGQKLPESKYTWMAFLGPDTPPLGERSHLSAVTQNQIAATLAAFLGYDYNRAVLQSGKPISSVLSNAN
jgi:hypothetical protein